MSQPGSNWYRAAHVTLAALALPLALVSSAGLLAGCEDSTSAVAVQLNLDRPVDVAFACYGGLRLTAAAGAPGTADNAIEAATAQPITSCDVRSAPRLDTEAIPLPVGQEDLTAAGGAAVPGVSYYGFILQSGPGTVAVARFPAVRATSYTNNQVETLDADPLTPGKTSISVGIQPVGIATDQAGCFAVTANAGTCDLSTLNINSALQFDGQAEVTRVKVTNSAGVEIKARPAAILMASDPSRVGAVCPATPTGLAYVAYPSCRVVAAVNLATGMAESSISFAADGTATLGTGAFTCEAECVAPDDPQPAPIDAGGPQPASLDFVRDDRVGTRRLAIGGRNSNLLTIVELDAVARPTAVAQLPLAEEMTGLLGVLDVALSPQIGMGNGNKPLAAIDDTIGPQYQFAYAVGTDGTVRVADVLNANRECDTQIDPRVLRSPTTTADELNCIEIGTKPRRTGARGPGIVLPTDGVASAVTIIRSDLPVLATETMRANAGPSVLNGYFGVATSTTGATYVIDIDDEDKADLENTADPRLVLSVDIATTMPHQLRDAVANRGAVAETTNDDGTTSPICNTGGPIGGGGARLNGAFNVLNLPEVVTSLKAGQLPFIRQALCVGSDVADGLPVPESAFAAPLADRKAAFPDTRALRPAEDWRLIWEGPLSADSIVQAIDGLSVRLGVMKTVGSNILVTDRSRPFCAAGVEDYDLVQLRGCDPLAPSGQCPLGSRCVLHPEATTGLGTCLPERNADALLNTCRDFMVAVRRYTIAPGPKSSELTLLPRVRELRSTPLSGCTSDTQCKTLADHELQQASDLEPKDAGGVVSPRTYACRPDSARKGAFATPATPLNRCMMTCTQDSQCDAASSCNEATGLCMEGPTPPAECIAGTQRYDLRAAEAFTLLGTLSGYVHPVIRNPATDVCEKPATPTLQIGRIPLTAPPCTAGADSPNPCSTTVTHHRTEANILPGTCEIGSPETKLVTRTNVPAIWFRGLGMELRMVDPTYPGDTVCRGDRGGPGGVPLVDVPTAYTGLAYSFNIGGGLAPLPILTTAVVPVRVLRGPQQSIWIVDEGDYLSESISTASTKGKVFRVESKSLTTVNVMQ